MGEGCKTQNTSGLKILAELKNILCSKLWMLEYLSPCLCIANRAVSEDEGSGLLWTHPALYWIQRDYSKIQPEIQIQMLNDTQSYYINIITSTIYNIKHRARRGIQIKKYIYSACSVMAWFQFYTLSLSLVWAHLVIFCMLNIWSHINIWSEYTTSPGDTHE